MRCITFESNIKLLQIALFFKNFSLSGQSASWVFFRPRFFCPGYFLSKIFFVWDIFCPRYSLSEIFFVRDIAADTDASLTAPTWLKLIQLQSSINLYSLLVLTLSMANNDDLIWDSAGLKYADDAVVAHCDLWSTTTMHCSLYGQCQTCLLLSSSDCY